MITSKLPTRTASLFLGLVAFLLCTCGIANSESQPPYIKVYSYPWDDQFLNKEKIETIRRDATFYLEIKEKYTALHLIKKFHIDELQSSTIKATSDFKIQLVMDVYSQDGETTILSNGKQLCSRDLLHCVAVDSDFKRRFDPTYEQE
jgi:hypothetical protein